VEALRQPADLIAWLNRYHHAADPMPPVLAERLLALLRAAPAYAGWPLDELLRDPAAFTQFIREQWRAYVQQETGQLLGEAPVRYLLPFEADPALQDTLPGLVRSGALEPVRVEAPEQLPAWARLAALAADEERLPRRIGELLAELHERLSVLLADARWPDWQTIARLWAELNALRHTPGARLDPTQQAACAEVQAKLDTLFLDWLRRRYAPLGSQRLPTPHHVHHVPHAIAYQRRQGQAERVALLVMDGMSLADWQRIGPAWRARHTDWRFHETLVLAQVPTITAISRQALVSGLRPADFADTLADNEAEPRQWAAFWGGEGLPEDACLYVHLALEREAPPPELESARVRALCLVDGSVDDLLHRARLGAVDLQASLRLWLEAQSPRLEALIAGLLARGFSVTVTSDHGHVEARGMGQPSEGLTVRTRSKRARVYPDRRAALNVQQAFSQTILWGQDGLLPDGVWALMPQGRAAFAPYNETVVTHGGPTLEEVVVPLVTIQAS
jgi:hypothetical protein